MDCWHSSSGHRLYRPPHTSALVPRRQLNDICRGRLLDGEGSSTLRRTSHRRHATAATRNAKIPGFSQRLNPRISTQSAVVNVCVRRINAVAVERRSAHPINPKLGSWPPGPALRQILSASEVCRLCNGARHGMADSSWGSAPHARQVHGCEREGKQEPHWWVTRFRTEISEEMQDFAKVGAQSPTADGDQAWTNQVPWAAPHVLGWISERSLNAERCHMGRTLSGAPKLLCRHLSSRVTNRGRLSNSMTAPTPCRATCRAPRRAGTATPAACCKLSGGAAPPMRTAV